MAEAIATFNTEPRGSMTASAMLDHLSDRIRGIRGTPSDSVALVFVPVDRGTPDTASFLVGTGGASLQLLAETRSSVVIVEPELLDADHQPGTLVVAVDRPRREFARLTAHFFPTPQLVEQDIHPRADVHPTAVLGAGTQVGPGAVVGPGVVIGTDCRIRPNATILPGCRLGDRVDVGPGATLGHTGFSYEREEDGTPIQIPHRGGVQVGSDVEIGANACIDRGVFDDTVLDDHVKVDNLAQIGHNVHVGRGSYVIAGAVLCGGVRVGARVWISPNAVVREKITVGDDATVGIGANVMRDVAAGSTVTGAPARPALMTGS